MTPRSGNPSLAILETLLRLRGLLAYDLWLAELTPASIAAHDLMLNKPLPCGSFCVS